MVPPLKTLRKAKPVITAILLISVVLGVYQNCSPMTYSDLAANSTSNLTTLSGAGNGDAEECAMMFCSGVIQDLPRGTLGWPTLPGPIGGIPQTPISGDCSSVPVGGYGDCEASNGGVIISQPPLVPGIVPPHFYEKIFNKIYELTLQRLENPECGDWASSPSKKAATHLAALRAAGKINFYGGNTGICDWAAAYYMRSTGEIVLCQSFYGSMYADQPEFVYTLVENAISILIHETMHATDLLYHGPRPTAAEYAAMDAPMRQRCQIKEIEMFQENIWQTPGANLNHRHWLREIFFSTAVAGSFWTPTQADVASYLSAYERCGTGMEP